MKEREEKRREDIHVHGKQAGRLSAGHFASMTVGMFWETFWFSVELVGKRDLILLELATFLSFGVVV